MGETGSVDGPGTADIEVVAALLGRAPRGPFVVVVRGVDGRPVVIRNAPLLDDGTPMPTRHWLVDPGLRVAVSRLEATGAIDVVEAEIGVEVLAGVHERAAAERDVAMPFGWDGPRPTGGVAGTRVGVKCLHAHLADHLAGVDDPVGAWVAARLDPAGPIAGRAD